jgi:NAD(P)-dependent dehydrogenase (short-subunit alcohol dehydrogenase family)
MSIIERTNPLNLQYRVCVVTSAFSPLGVIICKTLLKANALVLGIDTRPRDESLNAGLGTHFQCENCDVNDSDVPERIVEAAKEKYGVERMDVLVNVLDAGKEDDLEGLEKMSRRLVEVMAKERTGSVVTVLGDVEGVEESKAKAAVSFLRP